MSYSYILTPAGKPIELIGKENTGSNIIMKINQIGTNITINESKNIQNNSLFYIFHASLSGASTLPAFFIGNHKILETRQHTLECETTAFQTVYNVQKWGGGCKTLDTVMLWHNK